MGVLRVLVGGVVSVGVLGAAFFIVHRKWNPGPAVEVEQDFGALTAAEKEKIAADAKPFLAAHPPAPPELDPVVRKVTVGLPGGVRSMAMSGDGKVIALAMRMDKSIHVLDENGVEVRKLVGEDSAERISLSGDGKKLLAFVRNGTSVVWDVDKGEIAAVLSQHNSVGGQGAITPDGKHAVTATFEAMTVWNTETGDKETAIAGGSGGFQSLAVNDRAVVAGTVNGRVVVMDLATAAVADEIRRVKSMGDVSPYIMQCAFWGSEEHVLFSDQGGVWLWDRKERKVRRLDGENAIALMGGPEGHWLSQTPGGETFHFGMADGYVKELQLSGGGSMQAACGQRLAAGLTLVNDERPEEGYELRIYDSTQVRQPRQWKAPAPVWSDEFQ